MKLTMFPISLVSTRVILCSLIHFYFVYYFSFLLLSVRVYVYMVYGCVYVLVHVCHGLCVMCGGERTISDVVLASILLETASLFTAVCARLSRP